MANIFKNVIDKQMWCQVTPTANQHTAGGSLCSDLRNDITRNPNIYQLVSATVLNKFNIITKGWMFVRSPALTGTFGAGAGSAFAPSRGLFGSIGAGCTPTSIITTTTITAVGANMFANRAGSGEYGFRVRITGLASGKVEERWIVGNTSGTTPTLSLDTPLSFTPESGDTYEILSGRIFMLSAGALASGGVWKSYEIAANTLSTLGYTNLPATIGTEASFVVLDELYVPAIRKPGEGFLIGGDTYDTGGVLKGCLTATAIGASMISGHSVSGIGDNGVLANEYRNFQIRIVEDTVNHSAVGQRRIIASHTAGSSGVSPIYTLGSAWTVTPSANAKFVIECPNLILLFSSATAVTYTYNYSGLPITNGTNTIAADAWSITYFGNRPAVMSTGCTSFASFGITPDINKNVRHSYIYSFRGGSTALDMLDIAGSPTGTWSGNIAYDGAITISTGSCGSYAPSSEEGKFGYMNIYTSYGLSQMYRFDVKHQVLSPETPTDWVQTGTAASGDRVATYVAIDGDDKYSIVFLLSHLSIVSMELIVLT